MSLFEIFAWAWALEPALRDERGKFAIDPGDQSVMCLACGEHFDAFDTEEIEAHDCS